MEKEKKIEEHEEKQDMELSENDKQYLEETMDTEQEKEETEKNEEINKEIKEEKTKKDNKKNIKIIFALISIFIILFLASYGYNYYQNKKAHDEIHKEYNYFSFDKDGKHWKTTWIKGNQPYIISLRHWPGELEDIEVAGKLNQAFNNSKNIYLTFHPEGDNLDYLAVSATELALNLNQAIGKNITIACLVNKTEDCNTRPIVSCSDDDKAVIYLKQSDEPKVTLSGNCMIIEGRGEDIIKASERILYVWYGIMAI